jgi:hypothetical protein
MQPRPSPRLVVSNPKKLNASVRLLLKPPRMHAGLPTASRKLSIAQKFRKLHDQNPGHAAYVEGLIDRLLV